MTNDLEGEGGVGEMCWLSPGKSQEGLRQTGNSAMSARGQSDNTARLKKPTLFDTIIPLLGIYPKKELMNVCHFHLEHC